jgi:hypothetical protein
MIPKNHPQARIHPGKVAVFALASEQVCGRG